MDDAFDRYPNIEIVADATEPVYRVKYMESVREAGLVRFVKHELKVPRKKLEAFVADFLKAAGRYGR